MDVYVKKYFMKIYLYSIKKFLYISYVFLFLMKGFMKKFTFLIALPLILLAGCGNNEEKVDIMDNDIHVEVCDKYFELAECIIDKTQDANWTPEMKNELKNDIKSKQKEWSNLVEDELVEQCSSLLSSLQSASDLDKIWCSID